MRDLKTGIITFTLAALLVMGGTGSGVQAAEMFQPGDVMHTPLTCSLEGKDFVADGIERGMEPVTRVNVALEIGVCYNHPPMNGTVIEMVREVLDKSNNNWRFWRIKLDGVIAELYSWNVIMAGLAV